MQRLPGFDQGDVSVQDAAAQIAAPLLVYAGGRKLPAGARVLDACAAPGGKTAHLLELADLDVTALDADPERLVRVHRDLAAPRPAGPHGGGRRQPAEPLVDGQPFDAILLDAPCSASGIVRRHPDVRWLRRDTDIAALARTQDAILNALWPLLKPGGHLLYCTCSVFKMEGQDRIDAFCNAPATPRRSRPPVTCCLWSNTGPHRPRPGGWLLLRSPDQGPHGFLMPLMRRRDLLLRSTSALWTAALATTGSAAWAAWANSGAELARLLAQYSDEGSDPELRGAL